MAMKSNHVNQKTQALWTTLILMVIFFGVEIGVGILSNSLSLLVDAEHIFSDIFSLGLALVAMWLSRSWAGSTQKWGRYRPEILAALANGISLACVAAWIFKEAISRIQSPPAEILGLPMLITALIGLAVNSFNVFSLHGSSHQDLNVKGVLWHIVADLVSSVGTVLAAIAVIWLGWNWADGVISLAVASLIAVLGAVLVVQSINCLRGQVADISCLCSITTNLSSQECLDRQKAEKILFPTLQEMI